MGRYYYTNTGRGGKFGFATQSSTDPKDFFGMEETGIVYSYYSCQGDLETIKSKMDLLFDKIGVPKEERKYYMDEDFNEWVEKMNDKYIFRKIPKNEAKGTITYHCEEPNMVQIEKYEGAFLDSCRVYLGATIYSDIKEVGYCDMTAEP